MSTFQQHLQRMFILVAVFLLPMTTSLRAQQLPDPHFEDWSGSKFDGKEQLKNWNASNVEQLSFKFNFAHKEAGRSGYCMMVQDQDVGAAGITETSPGYFSLGQPWVYLESLTKISEATAGTAGGISWNHRPDSMSVWIKRTGSNIDKEDFYLLYYAWSGTAVGNKFKGKNGKCTSVTKQDEESDVRYDLNGNECGTAQAANQIAEGMWRERKQYGNWTNIRVPIYYFNSDAPTKMNIIFSASNYPNYRANSGLYAGNSLYVDDVELIYSSKIQKLYIGGKEWKGFDPNSTEVQVYSLGETATTIPDIIARRGSGSLTNARGKTVPFSGRVLSGSEITITKGDLESTPTRILVKAEDGSSQTLYQIQFQRAPSSNASLAEVTVNGETYTAFRPGQTNYNVELPYGTTAAPVIGYTAAEDGQVVTMTQATSPTGTATIHVTAPDGVSTMTYTLSFFVGQLKDVTLQDIKVNGKSIIGFTPSQAVYKVSLPVGTPSLTVEPVSAYPAGEQTITITPNPLPTGEAINGTTVQIVVSAPGATSTKTYKLNIKIEESSYSYLADLQVVGEQVSDINPSVFNDPTILAFDPEVTTYYVNLKMGTKELPYILYTPGDEYQTITIDEGGLDGTTRISVLAGNRSDQTVYKLVFSTAKSEISTLSGLEIGGVPVVGFASDVTNYTYELPIGTTVLPEITPIPGDEFQEISVTPGGVNGKTRISVTAGNGNTTNYYITFSVKRYDDNTLKSLSVGPYYSLQDENYHPIAFDPLRNDYYVKLEKDSLPTVHFELQNEEYQDIVVIRPTSANGKYKITVRPTNGLSRTYTIQFVYKKSDNTALQMIYVNDTIKGVVTPLPDFAPDKIDYTFTLDTGTTVMPDVIYDLSEPSQVVTKTWDANNKRVVRLSVLAESGAKRTYKIKFMVPSAASTQLDSILLVEGKDTILLPGFKKDVYEYTYPLTTETCPKILAVKAVEDQQVTITAPYAAGIATVLVKMDESTSQYTIDFVKAPSATVQLSDILINGVSLEGFVPTQLSYTGLHFSGNLPNVEGVVSDAAVEVRWKETTAYLNVQDLSGNKAIYSVAFERDLSGNNQLEGIYADGVLLSDFEASKLIYSYDLAAGSAYPSLSYKASQDAEVVFFGQVAEGKWAVVVSAENGEKQTYTVQYNIAKYSDATLVNMELAGFSLSPAFDSNTFEYAVTIDEGAALPKLTVETRPGQTIMQNNANDTLQQVIVFAENGASNTYSVRYTRQLSSNALLADILINGVSLEGFDPTVEDYTDSLPRNTQVVPNVFPIGQLSNQTITTYFSRPNGVTRIHVVAQDNTEKDYRIAFPVRQSNNTLLGDLYLDSEDAEIKFKPATTDYEVILPYEATECPKMVYEKAEPEQRIDVVSRPIGQTSQIIVTAENGDARTYNILFKRAILKTRNILAAIHILELDKDLSLKDKDQRDFNVEMPFGSRSLTVSYEKMYPEQTVFIQPGGVTAPTIITVKANNDSVADEVYRIIPSVPTADPAVLTDIRVNNTTITGFNPEQFSYIVKVTDKPILRYTLNKGAEINILDQTSKHWKAEVSYGTRTNTYEVWYYYQNDVIPNMDFQNWENARTTTSARKPTGWNVLADFAEPYEYKPVFVTYTFTPGEEVQQDGSNSVAYLHTQYNDAPLAGYVPGYMTLGDIEYHYQRWGSSAFSISGGITFRNTPDEMSYRIKVDKVNNNARVLYTLNGTGGETTLLQEEATTSDYVIRTMDLTDANNIADEPTQLNITFNSFDSESGKNGTVGGEAKMYVDWMKLAFNHTLTSMKANGLAATKSGNAFEVTLDNSEYIEKPILSFTGEVRDQAQDVVWAAPTKDADFEIRTADIRNWAENGVDHTDYTLTVKRPLDEVNVLSALLAAGDTLNTFNPATTSYTITIPSSQRNLPDLQPIPGSSLQQVTTAYSETDSTMTITVTPEKGDAKVYTVKFVTALSDDVTLKALTAEGITFDPDQKTYDITATRLPLISFEKQSDLQTVVLNNGVLTVTAEDGVTTGTYTINRLDPVITPNGTISEFEQKGNVLTDFGGTTYEKEAAKPADYITFTRAQLTDSVIFVQAPDKMTWAVPGTLMIYTWTYPTDESTNANLKMITINGEDYQDFIPSELNYELTTDSTMVIVAEPAEEVQQLVSTFELANGGVLYSTTVTAQSGVQQTYRVRVTRPLSDIATLDAILLDSTLIEGFAADKFNYTVTLPIASGAKQAQPKMPNITYVAGQRGQKITVTPGELNGEETTIAVLSEDENADTEYSISIRAQKSSCADLTGITVNGVALDHFEPGRHHYSVSLATNDINVDYTSDDRFQTVTTNIESVKAGHEYHYTLHVVAEDGTASDYLVEIYVENQSNDAQLANILLNGRSMDRFEPLYNSDIIFDGGNNNYEIKLPATTKMPEVSAQLKMDGQHVEIEHRRDEHMNIDSILLNVTAVDSVTHNIYVLRFVRPMSTNSQLSLIEINNEPIVDFEPNTYFYSYDMKSGEEMPRITVETADEAATYDEPDYSHEGRITITVYAQDYAMDQNHKSTYTIAINVKKSDVATLDMIYQGRDSLPGFKPTTFYYAYELGADETFPDLSWQDPDNYPTVSPIDTVEYDPVAQKLVRQIKVTAEDTTISNTYTVAYTIRKSDIDTLQMIFIGSKPLPNFKANIMEYEYKLTAAEVVALDGELPEIDPIPGEEGKQKIEVLQVRDNYGVKTVGYKHVVTVTAAAGNSRTYTVHYPRELSDDATLKMIFVDENPLPNFDAERNSYKIELDYGVPVPNVTEAAKDFQKVKHNQHGDTVEIIVTAELETVQNVYTLVFERRKSDVTMLRNIILLDAKGKQLPYDLFAFQSKLYDYTIEMPYVPGDTTYALPDITVEKADSLQTVVIETETLKKTEKIVTVRVIAPNGEDEAEYKLFFDFLRNDDAFLTEIKTAVNDSTFALIKGFKSTNYSYIYEHPYGFDSSQFISSANVKEKIAYVKSDPLATDSIYVEANGTIRIVVTAQDEKTQSMYSIQQKIGKDTVNLLKMIYLDFQGYGDYEELVHFDPEQTFYKVMLPKAANGKPKIKVEPMSENATILMDWDLITADTMIIYCTSQSGVDRIYRVYVENTTFNDGATAISEKDVFIRRKENSNQLFVATFRSGVFFYLYDRNGHLIYSYENLPVADPNSYTAYKYTPETDFDVLVDVNMNDYPNAGIYVDIKPGEIYFYSFISIKKIISSGKIKFAALQ